MSTIDNINGIYAKDTELRNGISELRGDILSQTIKPLSVTKNGTYTADPTIGAYGYSPITVDVQEQPWQPLQDGYSNFWFELTNDTLSPWLNFSAKNNDAVIDWGDGSGEQALDTRTPTHTYSKPGRYIVKVKGVTGIATQNPQPFQGEYNNILQYVELNNEVTSLARQGFFVCGKLKKVVNSNLTTMSDYGLAYSGIEDITFFNGLTDIPMSMFYYCYNLGSVTLPNSITTIYANAFSACLSLPKITIPANVVSIGNTAFSNCLSLREIHMQAIIPPTIGTNIFASGYSNFIIYVPVGYGDTYKSTTGWSSYADHIAEEGQNLSKSQLRAIAEEQKKSDNGEEMK